MPSISFIIKRPVERHKPVLFLFSSKLSSMEAAASCEAQGSACTDLLNIVNPFINLPDDVAHHILSFLTSKDLIRVSCVSKRYRHLCLSVPSMNFNLSFLKKLRPLWKRSRVINSFDRFLIHRGDAKIQHLRICWTDTLDRKTARQYDELFKIFTWIHNAVRCNVEVLDLYLHTLQVLPLPSCLFSCPSLRSLVLDFGFQYLLEWPSSLACSPNLQCFKLRNAQILGDEKPFCKWISSSCKFFKELQVEEVDGIKNITIESSSLESFSFVETLTKKSFAETSEVCHLNISGEKLEDMHIEYRRRGSDSPPGSKSLHIFAPNLKYLKWSGLLISDRNLGKLMRLEKAEILLNDNVDDFDNLFELLCSVRSVKVLILNKQTTKALFRDVSVPLPLDNIYYLALRIESLSDYLIPAMVSVLRGMTTLSTLCLKSDPSFSFYPMKDANISSGFNMQYWKSQNIPIINQLKEVTIEVSNGSNELVLARYILEHAHNLKKMVLLHSEGPQQSNVVEMLGTSKMIATATVLLNEKQSSCPRKKVKRKRV